MPLQLFNTLSGKVEEFHPLEDNLVRMYACGPTVYDYGHIGNFRTFIVVDTLRRFLKQSGYKLKHVMNITDVDDKIIRNAAALGVSVQDYTKKYKQAFLEDADALNIQHPEFLVNATDHIQEMAHFIKGLEEKGFAYRTEDGSYYFRIAKFPEYGKLSKKDFAGMNDGARVDVDEYDKDNARDFALWKAPKPGEAMWETEIGPGRPGWHIECSQMSMKYLGESFDIHAGGEDLIFPHHENEIAQSEALTGKPFVHVWVHARFLLVEGEKMAKSAGNFFTVRDLILMGHKPSSIRFLLMSVPYRKQLNFTFDGLTQAANSVERLRNFKLRLETSQFADDGNVIIAEIAERTSAEMRAGLGRRLEHGPRAGRRLRHGARRERRRRCRGSPERRRTSTAQGSRRIRRDLRGAEGRRCRQGARDRRVGKGRRPGGQDQRGDGRAGQSCGPFRRRGRATRRRALASPQDP